jgi:hypothetical protein
MPGVSPDLWNGPSLDAVRRGAVLTREELWVRYIGLGGMLGIDELTRYLAGTTGLTRLEHNTVVQALNEHFVDLGGDHPVPYDDEAEL